MKKIFESFFLLILILECSSSILYLPNNLTIKVDTPILELSHLKKPSPISSVLVQTGYGLEGLRNCSGINQQFEKKVNGSVAAFILGGGCTINQLILNAQTHGSIAVVIFEEIGWYYARLIQKYKKTGQIKIPTFFIKRSIFDEYIKKRFEKSENITIYLEQSKNDLDKLNEAAIIFFQILYFFLFFTAIILIMRKIILFLISKEFWFNLQGVVLVLSLLANITSFMFVIDPYGVHKMITSYEYFSVTLLKFLFQDQTTLTISFYLVWVLRKFIPKTIFIISLILFGGIIIVDLTFIISETINYLMYKLKKVEYDRLTLVELVLYGVMSLYCLTGAFSMAKILNPFFNLNSDVQPKKRKEYIIIAICVLIFALINFSNFSVHTVGVKYTLHSNVYWRFSSTFIYCFFNGITGITLSFLLKSKVERNKKINNNRFSFTNGTSRNIQMSSNF